MAGRPVGRKTLLSAYIYLEGGATGAGSKYLKAKCQEAFHKLLDRMGFAGRKPRLVACGGRGDVYERFVIEHSENAAGYVAMWIDSEEPMANPNAAWQHLQNVTTVPKWEKPARAQDDQVLFMTTCMETWIMADHEVLREHYGHKLHEPALPPLVNLENRVRHDVQDRLERATHSCKNAYKKGALSYEILAALNPATLRQHLPSFVRAHEILKTKL
jgi:hypothetical protein